MTSSYHIRHFVHRQLHKHLYHSMSQRALLALRSGASRRAYNSVLGRAFSSSSGDVNLDTDSTDELEGTTNNEIVFPWRHEEDPLPRIVPGTEEYEAKGHLLSTVNTPLGNPTLNALTTAYMFLDVPIWQLLFFGSFKQEMTESMSWAFTQSINNLLSRLTNEPANNTADFGEISFKTTLSNTKGETETADILELDSMLEGRLLDLYQTSTKDALASDGKEICLQSKPYSAELVSLYCIPYISRSNSKTDPNLLKFYRTMLEKVAMERQSDLSKLRKDHLETGKMESTVIAQVLIWCKEKFYVKDTASGALLQGQDDEEGRNVPHLVRMEMTVKTEKDPTYGRFVNKHDNWIITDIDDLVDGNLIV
jgi:hypothetical protein